jgi:flagellar assembly factor FliW
MLGFEQTKQLVLNELEEDLALVFLPGLDGLIPWLPKHFRQRHDLELRQWTVVLLVLEEP